MLEIIDHSIPIILKALNVDDVKDENILYASKNFALRLRQEKLGQESVQPMNVIPFISYFRTKHEMSRFNQRLNKVGIPYDKNSNLDGRVVLTPMQPVKLTYEVIIWEKDAVKVNKWMKEFYSRSMKIQNVTISVDNSVDYKLTAQLISPPIDAFYSGGREKIDLGQMFLFSFSISIIGAIPDIHEQDTKFRIQTAIVNYDIKPDLIKQEFKIENGQVTRIL
jgi:hypothetical protein